MEKIYTTRAVTHYLFTDKGREEVTDTAWGTILSLLSEIRPEVATAEFKTGYVDTIKVNSTAYFVRGKRVALTLEMYDEVR